MINEIYDTQSLNENQLFYFQTDFGQVIDIKSLNITTTRILNLRFAKFLPLRSYFQTLN